MSSSRAERAGRERVARRDRAAAAATQLNFFLNFSPVFFAFSYYKYVRVASSCTRARARARYIIYKCACLRGILRPTPQCRDGGGGVSDGFRSKRVVCHNILRPTLACVNTYDIGINPCGDTVSHDTSATLSRDARITDSFRDGRPIVNNNNNMMFSSLSKRVFSRASAVNKVLRPLFPVTRAYNVEVRVRF